jgi:type II restriction/modification system DNA methylase subunit YeeA
LKKNKKITPENIPAATQLFTPHWIVRYLVENSLGRLWLLNRPGSKLAGQMDYYIKPEQPETDFLKISSPEEIKICDPACGSGHMLTYAFDLLYTIYEEEGYEPAEIPEKILTHNLYGIEIDERAGELAAFALTMKARAKQRRFFNKGVKPNICVLENVDFDEGELKSYMDFVGRDLFTAPLQTTLRQFEEVDNFGSLIRPDVTDVDGMLRILESKNVSGQLFISMTHQKLLQALRQANYLSPKYHVVIANPPYMGSKSFSPSYKSFVKKHYPEAIQDAYSCFIVRNLELVRKFGYSALITIPNWMFLSTFETLRDHVLHNSTIVSLCHNGRGVWGSDFGSCAFILKNGVDKTIEAVFRRLFYRQGEVQSNEELAENFLNEKRYPRHPAYTHEFLRLPGFSVSYWLSKKSRGILADYKGLGDFADFKQGMSTTDSDRFVRYWHEPSLKSVNFTRTDPFIPGNSDKWFPFNKGGGYRKWYGNQEHVVLYEKDGEDLIGLVRAKYPNISDPEFVIKNRGKYFKEGITYTSVSSAHFGVRFIPKGFIFSVAGPMIFAEKSELQLFFLSNLCSRIATKFLQAINPSLGFQGTDIAKLPFSDELIKSAQSETSKVAIRAIETSKTDWDSFETSWDFTSLPLLNPDYRQPTLKATYQTLRAHWREKTLEMQRLEQENNRIFIDAYGLQDELTPEVPLKEITLTCNPHYRYGGNKSEDELEALLLTDSMRELVSYALGCMFGRYALDKPGLILANQGETIEDYLKRVPEPSFPADDDNVIPMLDGDWFTDDIADRFRQFLRVAFGDEHYEENLRFVEQGLNIKGKRNYSIRDYFLSEFYTDHVKRYKKRPIYWMFSSPKGSFNALIYMHRYRPDTVSVVLNDYLREFRIKLTSHKNHLEAVSISASSAQAEKTKALKEIEKITKMISEMEEYEREVLYPLATEQVEIDLDDGVKVNYPKLGAALKKIVGLDAKED